MKTIYEYGDVHVMYIKQLYEYSNEPRRKKTCIERYASELRQPQKIDRGLTEKTDLSSKNNGAGHMAVIALLICVFVFAYQKPRSNIQ